MSIINNTELQQRITDLRQRLDKIPKFHIREDYTSLIDFLSETQSFLYSTLSAINAIANNIDDIISVSSNITELLQVDTNATLAEESAAAAVLSANSAASATTLCQEYMNTAEEAKEDAEQALSNVITIFNEQLIEYASSSAFPTIGEENVIYIALDTGTKYKWSGTIYNELGGGISLGETSFTAYRGDRGKTAYDHSQSTANPHGITKTTVELGNVDNTSDANKPISTATQTALNLKVDKVTGKGLSTEDYTNIEKTKLAGIAENANNYTHPSTHSADILTDGEDNRLFSTSEKNKLSGIENSANNYVHPETHSADILTDGEDNRLFSNDEKTKLANLPEEISLPLGVNQTWQSVSRSIGTTYTNDTGRTIYISVAIKQNTQNYRISHGYIDNVETCSQTGNVYNDIHTVQLIVPAGSTYRISFNENSSLTINYWRELR